jgi:hypothetical protein
MYAVAWIGVTLSAGNQQPDFVCEEWLVYYRTTAGWEYAYICYLATGCLKCMQVMRDVVLEVC